MADEIKAVQITGGAASDLSGGGKKKRTYTKRAKGGGGEAPSTINTVRVGGSSASTEYAAANSSTWLKYPSGAPIPPPIQSSTAQPLLIHQPTTYQPAVSQEQRGGATKHIKVELKKKTSAKKVHLNPKKPEIIKHGSKKHQTKKARKITLGVVSLHKRITHAKKLHKKVKEMPIEALKEKLIKAKLIKESSKAPESILRQIAADAAVVKNKAL